MNTTKLTLFSLISKGIALKILTLLFLVCNIQVKFIWVQRYNEKNNPSLHELPHDFHILP